MFQPSVRAGAAPGQRHSCAAGKPCRRIVFAALAALAAAPGCSSDPGPELPLEPCGVEHRYHGDEVRLAYSHLVYDERGNHVLTERDFDIDGIVDDRFVWEYAPHGGLTLATQSYSSGNMMEVAVEYGDGERVASVTWLGFDGTTGRVDYEYDGAQRIIAHWDRNDDGVAEESTTYTYDAGGKLEGSSSRCAGDAAPNSTTTMTWGEGGRIERIEGGPEGESTVITELTYDQDGLLERWERSYYGEVLSWRTFEYDGAGNVKAASYASVLVVNQDPRQWQVTDTVYDADGRILTAKSSIEGRLSAEFIYLYECPGYEDSPGRSLAAPSSPLPPLPVGPRGGVGADAIAEYAFTTSGPCL